MLLIRGFFLLICTLLSNASFAGELAGALHIRGSTTFLPLAQRVAETYMDAHPKVKLTLAGGGTQRGYKSLLDGTADVAMVSGDLPDELQQTFSRKHIKLHTTTCAYSGLVVAVHPLNPLQNLTIIQLQGIFSGRISNWKELGGNDSPIHVLIGPPSGGITEIWKTRVLGDDNTYTPQAAVLPANVRLQSLKNDPKAITYLPLTESSPELKIMRINGVAPTPPNLHSGKYPLRTALALVSRAPASALVKDFSLYMQAELGKMGTNKLVSVAEETP